MHPLTQKTMDELSGTLETLGLKPAGRLKARRTNEIEDNRISIGMQCLHQWDVEPTYPALAELGAKRARVYSTWALTEKTKGVYDFSWLEKIVDKLLEMKMKPFLCMAYGNPVYSKTCAEPGGIGHNPFETKESLDAYVRYTGKLAEKFTGRVEYYEVWNEPQLPSFFSSDKPWHEDYARLVRQASASVRSKDPNAKIVAGACAGMEPEFLLDFFKHEGVADAIDVISYHEYRPIPEQVGPQRREAFKTTLRHMAPDKALWMDEAGCPSHVEPGGEYNGAITDMPNHSEACQAKWLARNMINCLSDEDISLVAYFRLYDHPHFKTKIVNHYGVLRRDCSFKPSFFALKNICSLFDQRTRLQHEAYFDDYGIDTNSKFARDACLVGAIRLCFERNGCPMLVHWSPSEPNMPFEPTSVVMAYWLPGGIRFERPLAVDLLTGKTYELIKDSKHRVLHGVPLTNYPVMVVERDLFKEFLDDDAR